MAQVAVVIPNWNSLHHLESCLASLPGGTSDLELMVVDNGSEDRSVEWLEENSVPHLSLPENRGFAEAVNRGVAATEAPLLLVLNADARLAPGCLEQLADRLGTDTELGGVQPLILQDEGTGEAEFSSAHRIYSAGQALTRDGRAYELRHGDRLGPTRPLEKEVFGVCGAACLLKREMFEQLKGYDESYFSFYEDVDLNMRARAHGWRFRICSDAIAWHVGNAVWQKEFRRPGAENARLVARNRLATQIKFMPLRSIPRMIAVEAGSIARAVRQRRLRPTLAGKLAALARFRVLLRERRCLAIANPGLEAARRWLGDAR